MIDFTFGTFAPGRQCYVDMSCQNNLIYCRSRIDKHYMIDLLIENYIFKNIVLFILVFYVSSYTLNLRCTRIYVAI